MSRKVLAWCFLLAFILLSTFWLVKYAKLQRQNTLLLRKIEQIVPVAMKTSISCEEILVSKPLVLLALGQSNAGNHGSASPAIDKPITVFAEGKCFKTTEPLPGGTGSGGSIWQRLPALLSGQLNERQVVLSVLAVDSSSIADWTRTSSPINLRLSSRIDSMKHMGMTPSMVLWQQGEADALIGTSANDYAVGLSRLAETLHEAGITAPIFLARSTICKTSPNNTIRNAIEGVVRNDRRFRIGPDTDTLSMPIFRNGCHLTTAGLDSAAKMWATVILTEESTN